MITINPLVWESEGCEREFARTPFGSYRIRPCARDGYWITYPDGKESHYLIFDLEDIRRIAQDHLASSLKEMVNIRDVVSFRDEFTALAEDISRSKPEGSSNWMAKEFCRARNNDGTEHVSFKITPQKGVYGSLSPHDAEFIMLMCKRAPQIVERFSNLIGSATTSVPDIRSAASLLARCFRDPDWADANIPGFRGLDFQAIYTAMTEDHAENLKICGTLDWPSTLIAGLEVLAGEGE